MQALNIFYLREREREREREKERKRERQELKLIIDSQYLLVKYDAKFFITSRSR